MKKQHAARFGIYLVGMVLLALGITLNTKAGLGASAIVSVPYTVSQGTGWDFANLTLIVYCILVAAQFVIKGQNRRLIDLLQIVVSIVFTRFMALFQHGITYQSGFFACPQHDTKREMAYCGSWTALSDRFLQATRRFYP